MKRHLITGLILALLFSVITLPAWGSDTSNAKYYGAITVTNNSTAAAAVSVNITGLNSGNLTAQGWASANLSDCAIKYSGADVLFMPGSPFVLWVDTIGANSQRSYTFYTSGVTGGTIYYFPGAAGMTISDNASLEFGSSFDLSITGYFDMTIAGGYVLRKTNAVEIYYPVADGKLEFYAGATRVLLGSMTSGLHNLRYYTSGGNTIMSVDGASVTTNTTTAVPDEASNFEFFVSSPLLYMTSCNISVGGTLRGSWNWEYGGTFTDDSGNGNTATPSFRTTSSDADVSANLTLFSPVIQPKAPAFAVGAGPNWITSNLTISGNFTSGNATILKYPGKNLIEAIASASATPSQFPLTFISGFIILAASISITAFLRQYGSISLIVKLVVLGFGFGVAAALHIYDWWMVIFLIIFGIFTLFGSRERQG